MLSHYASEGLLPGSWASNSLTFSLISAINSDWKPDISLYPVHKTRTYVRLVLVSQRLDLMHSPSVPIHKSLLPLSICLQEPCDTSLCIFIPDGIVFLVGGGELVISLQKCFSMRLQSCAPSL